MKNVWLPVIPVLIECSVFSQSLQLGPPPPEPLLFLEGIVSTSLNERDLAISPDGQEIFFTVTTPQSTFQTIACITRDARGAWSKPRIVPFAGKFSDLEPAFNGDGSRLYFASNRPAAGNEKKDFDLWVVERKNKTWSEPVNLGPTVNTGVDEFYPSVARNGNLYFTAQYDGGIGREDIYISKWNADHFEKPLPLDTAVNSKYYEFNAYVDRDEQFILFTSYGRKDDTGRGDIYMSGKDKSGKWLPAMNLKFLNSSRLDYCPYVSDDRSTLFFTSERAELPVSFQTAASYDQLKAIGQSISNGSGNIYWVSAVKMLELLR